ncbi:MAG: hypothetical protein EBR85_00620 [Betaproteobacteria bacterium]|nr:hypothetical protein [Betaproteobacteria bacterium]
MRNQATRSLMLLALLSASAAYPAYAQSESSLAGLLERMRTAAQSLSFSGIFVHQQDAVLQSSRIIQTRDAQQPVTKLQTLEGNRQEVIKLSGEIRIYMPDQQRVKIDQTGQPRSAFPAVIVGSPAAVLANYEVVTGGSMRVADVDAQEVLLKPRHEARWPVRVWMDKRTGLIVKCQKLDREGRTVEQAAFTALNFSPKPGPASSQPSFAGVKDWTVYNASFQPTTTAPPLKFRAEALRGFELVGSYERHGPAGLEMRRYVFSDGVAAVTVFVGPKTKESPLGDKAHRTGAVSMASKEFQDVRLTVFGDVPPEALRQFVQSIEWKTNL